jgi:uncharacterized small protein (TIGR04563 family)
LSIGNKPILPYIFLPILLTNITYRVIVVHCSWHTCQDVTLNKVGVNMVHNQNTEERLESAMEKEEKKENSITDKRKQSLYFPEKMLTEIKNEALRQDRSLSWIVQQAWRIARDQIRQFPSINIDTDEEPE